MAVAVMLAGTVAVGTGAAVLAVLLGVLASETGCGSGSAASASGPVALGPAGTGQTVGATEYGGPGDPSSGSVGASGANLLQHPDSYAELGGYTFQTATAMGGLSYMTPLRITWGHRSAIAYKRDFGFGGPPIDGFRRVIDLWWELAESLGIPYENGMWSGPVRIERPPASGAGALLGPSIGAQTMLVSTPDQQQDPAACSPGADGVPLTSGERATLLCERRGGGSGRCAGGGQGDHRRREPDRGQAVSLRRRSRPATVRRGSLV